jgi:hypothetical protein
MKRKKIGVRSKKIELGNGEWVIGDNSKLETSNRKLPSVLSAFSAITSLCDSPSQRFFKKI